MSPQVLNISSAQDLVVSLPSAGSMLQARGLGLGLFLVKSVESGAAWRKRALVGTAGFVASRLVVRFDRGVRGGVR